MSTFLLRDWLALHGVDAEALRHILRSGAKPAGSPAPAPQDPVLAQPFTANLVAEHLALALPPLAPLLERVTREVRFDLAPDRQLYPRPFTLDNDGTGRVLVSCPMSGRLSDILRLAHEIGHACQSLNCPVPPPPIIRELSAYLAEGLLIENAQKARGPRAAEMMALRGQKRHRIAREATRLLEVLDQPSAPYSYWWNYSPAWIMAERVQTRASPDRLARLFAAPEGLSDLIAEFGLSS